MTNPASPNRFADVTDIDALLAGRMTVAETNAVADLLRCHNGVIVWRGAARITANGRTEVDIRTACTLDDAALICVRKGFTDINSLIAFGI